MRLLLDTHVLLWWVTDDPKPSRQCAIWIEDRANRVAISPVSAYEMQSADAAFGSLGAARVWA